MKATIPHSAKRAVATLMALAAFIIATAQEVTVNVTAKYSPMPAQAALYLDNPGKYFTITLSNNSDMDLPVFLGIQMEQLTGGELRLTTPLYPQPSAPIILAAQRTVTLSQPELKKLFQEMPLSHVAVTGGSLDNILNGSVGLLPEGQYKGRITVYQWDRTSTNPQALSNPSTGECFFEICYRAPAPQITWPAETQLSAFVGEEFMEDEPYAGATVIDFEKSVPVFSWTPSTCPCSAGFLPPTYDLEFYEMPDGMTPSEAVLYGKMAYKVPSLSGSSYAMNLPLSTRKLTFVEGKIYIMRVVAKSQQNDASKQGFTLIENNGISPLRIFRVAKSSEKSTGMAVSGGEDGEKDGDGEKKEGSEEDGEKGDGSVKNVIKFNVPEIEEPSDSSDLNAYHILEEGKDLTVKWKKPVYSEADYKEIADTITSFKYKVGIYQVKTGVLDYDSILLQKPLLVKEQTDTLTHTFQWKDIEKAKLAVGKHYALIVTSKCTYIDGKKSDKSKDKAKSEDKSKDKDKENASKESSEKQKEKEASKEKADTVTTIKWIGDPQNVYNFARAPQFSNADPCNPDTPVLDPKPKDWNPAELKTEPIGVGAFDLYVKTIEKNTKFTGIQKDKGKAKLDGPAYKGTGYIVWQPYGKPTHIAVEFDSIRINERRFVIDGEIRSARNKDSNIPYDQLERLTSWAGVDRSDFDSYTDDLKEAAGEYWKYVGGGMGYASTIAHLIDGGVANAKGKTDAINLPLSLADASEMVPGGIPADISLMNMKFSPTNASMDLLLLMKIPDTKAADASGHQVLAFVAPGLCMEPYSPWTMSGKVALMYDLSIIDEDSEFQFDFKAPTSYKDINDGTFVEWKDGAFERLRIECAMNVPGILPDDGKGNIIKGQTGCYLDIAADIKDWGDWTAEATLLCNDGKEATGFQHEDAEGYTFITGGKRIIVDYSETRNANLMEFPQEYDWKEFGLSGDKAKDPKSKGVWKGLYVQDLEVKFPFTYDRDDDKTDKRIGLAIKNMLIDKTGFSCQGEVNNPMGDMGIDKFKMTVDRIYLDFVQNNFNKAGFNGTITIPLLSAGSQDSGTFTYDAKILYSDKDPMKSRMNQPDKAAGGASGGSSGGQTGGQAAPGGTGGSSEAKKSAKKWYAMFDCKLKEDFNLDWMLAEISIDKNGTYLQMTSDEEKNKTYVEFITSGKIGISSTLAGSKKTALGFKIPDIHFAGMRVANYAYQSKATERFTNTYTKAIEKAIEQYEQQKKDGKNDATNAYDWIKKSELDEYKAKTDSLIAQREVCNDDKTCYFSLGNWSLASMEKELWGIPLKLNKFDLKTDGDRVGVYVNGGVGLLGNEKFGIGATAGFTIWAKINWDDIDIKYDDTEFNDFQLKGQFASIVKIDGGLSVSKDDDKDGLEGSLTVEVKGLFKGDIAGAYYDIKKTDEDKKRDNDPNASDTYKAGYFIGEISGIPSFGAVSINSLYGGFYFNYAASTGDTKGKEFLEALKKPTPKYGVSGGAFGLGMVMGEKHFAKADLSMYILIDTKRSKVNEIHMQGNIHMLCASKDAESGLVNSTIDILYEDNTTDMKNEDEMKRFKLTVTCDATAEVKDLYKDFTDMDLSIPEGMANLEQFASNTADDQGDGSDDSGEQPSATNEQGERQQSSAEKKAEKKGYLSQGASAHIGLEIEVRNYPNRSGKERCKWHVYIGEPDESKRCRITFIDFALGKNSPVGVWAKVYANFYCCLGNELPNNGALPELPAKVQEALGGTDLAGNSNAGVKSKLQAEREKTVKNGPTGSIKGGIMVGAALGAEFGCNAVFCYADVEGMLGFDAVLKQYDANAKCTDGSSLGGKNGFYTMAQIYAMLKGEFGLMIDLWIFKGKVPLVDASLGAVLKGGLPNPSWAYGKVRAKGSVLGGLIKFNSSIELKVGRVCIPEYGNPLEDIKIFGDVSPGYEEFKDGWKEGSEVSPNTAATFTTNMRINQKLNLVDEGKRAKMAGMGGDEEKYTTACTRVYIFHLDPHFTVEKFANGESDDLSNRTGVFNVNYSSKDQENFTVDMGSLKANTFYKLTMGGYAKEVVNGVEVDPIFNDEESGYKDVHRNWHQENVSYFCTGNYSEKIEDDVQATLPVGRYDNYWATKYEAANPMLMLRHDRRDYWNNPDHEFDAEYTKHVPIPGRADNAMMWALPDIVVDKDGNRVAGQKSKFEKLQIMQMYETTKTSSGKLAEYATVVLKKPLAINDFEAGEYTFSIYRTDRKSLDEHMEKVEEAYKSIMAMTDKQSESVEAQLKEWQNDETNAIRKEMAEYYLTMQAEQGPNVAEQRMREYREQQLSNTGAFRTKIYSFTFRVGTEDTPKDAGIETDVFFNKSDKVMLCQWSNLSLTYKNERTMANDPYYFYNYWTSKAGARGSNVSSFRLNSDEFPGTLSPLTWGKVEYPYLRRYNQTGGSIEAGFYSDEEFASALCPTGYKGWISDVYAPDAWYDMLEEDAAVAQALDDAIYDEFKQNRKDYTVAGLLSLSTSNKVFKNWRKRTELLIEEGAQIQVYDKENNKWTKVNEVQHILWPPYQCAYMYAATDTRMGFNYPQYALRVSVTDQAYQMAHEKPYFTKDAALGNISQMSYDVRRITGYNCAEGVAKNELYGTRPSTIGMFQHHIVRNVRYTYGKLRSEVVSSEENDDIYIPDESFRSYIIKNHDKDGNRQISKAEAMAIKDIDLTNEIFNSKIYSLQGIEEMENLERLTLHGHEISSLSLGTNKQLRSLNVSGCKSLTSLSVTGLELLDSLDCSGLAPAISSGTRTQNLSSSDVKGLSFLDLTGCKNLVMLNVCDNNLETLDLSDCKQLKSLDCRANYFTTLDLTNLPALTEAKVGNQFTKGDRSTTKHYCNQIIKVRLVSTDTRLPLPAMMQKSGAKTSSFTAKTGSLGTGANTNVLLEADEASILDALDRNLAIYILKKYGQYNSYRSPLSEEFIATATKDQLYKAYKERYSLYYSYDKMSKETVLDVSDLDIESIDKLHTIMPVLTQINVSGNNIKNLDISMFQNLESLDAHNSKIAMLTLGDLTKLRTVNLNDNGITELDVSALTALTSLSADNNSITVFTPNTALTSLSLGNNLLTQVNLANLSKLQSLDLSRNDFMLKSNGQPEITLPTSAPNLKKIALAYIGGCMEVDVARCGNDMEVDVSHNKNLMNVKIPVKVKTLNTSFCPKMRYLENETEGKCDIETYLTYLKHYPIENLYMEECGTDYTGENNICYYFDAAPKVLDMTNSNQNRVIIQGSLPNEIYVGIPNRPQGEKVQLKLQEKDAKTRWDCSFRDNPKNANVYAYLSSEKVVADSLKMEQITDEDLQMQADLGEKLYNSLKAKYAPNKRALHVADARTITELNCSYKQLSDATVITKYFPQLVSLDCSGNYFKSADFRLLNNLQKLNVAYNSELTSLQLPSTVVDIDFSDTKVGGDVFVLLTNIHGKCKRLIANGWKSLKGKKTVNSSNIEYLSLIGTEVNHLSITQQCTRLRKLEYVDNGDGQILQMSVEPDTLRIGSSAQKSYFYSTADGIVTWLNRYALQNPYSYNVTPYDWTRKINVPIYRYSRSGKLNGADVSRDDIFLAEALGKNLDVVRQTLFPNDYCVRANTLWGMTTLDLSGRKLSNFPTDFFEEYMGRLKTLNLSNTSITSLTLGANPAVEEIDVSENKDLSVLTLGNSSYSVVNAANCALNAASTSALFSKVTKLSLCSQGGDYTLSPTDKVSDLTLSARSNLTLAIPAGKPFAKLTLKRCTNMNDKSGVAAAPKIKVYVNGQTVNGAKVKMDSNFNGISLYFASSTSALQCWVANKQYTSLSIYFKQGSSYIKLTNQMAAQMLNGGTSTSGISTSLSNTKKTLTR